MVISGILSWGSPGSLRTPTPALPLGNHPCWGVRPPRRGGGKDLSKGRGRQSRPLPFENQSPLRNAPAGGHPALRGEGGGGEAGRISNCPAHTRCLARDPMGKERILGGAR